MEIGIGTHDEGVEIGQPRHVLRQLVGAGHRGVLDQHRYDRRTVLQGLGDLGTNDIGGHREPLGVPPGSDEGDHHVGVVDVLTNRDPEVLTGRDRVDVEEDVVVTELARQHVTQTPGEMPVVGAAVRQKDLHDQSVGRCSRAKYAPRGVAELGTCADLPGAGAGPEPPLEVHSASTTVGGQPAAASEGGPQT